MSKKESAGFNKPFEGLKRLDPKPSEAAKGPTTAKPPASPAKTAPAAPKTAEPARGGTDDARSYEEAMRGAIPLSGAAARGRRTSPLGAPPPPAAPRLRAPARNDDADAEAELAELVQGGSSAARDGDKRLVRRLRDGDYPIEARLDLHGHTREEATAALERFVVQSVSAGRRCVLVIHGRGLNSGDGGPVLGEAVQRALSASAVARAILAFTHAGPAHGGDGATLVLLRRKRAT